MKTKSRLILWASVIFIVPIGIFIYDRGWNWDAFYWIIGTMLLCVSYETWHYFNTKTK